MTPFPPPYGGDGPPDPEPRERRRTRRARPGVLRAALRRPSGALGACIVTVAVLIAIFAPWLAPYGPTEGDFFAARRPPAWMEGGSRAHWLGTDALGQDVLSRVLHGARVSLLVGVLGAATAVLLGATLGMLAGWYGGWFDTLVTAFTNLLLAVPYLVLVIVIATVFGRSLTNVILLFGITASPLFVRVARGEILRLRRQAFVEAASGVGATPARILTRHLLPNLAGPIVTLATFEISAMIFYESGLGFLGLSVPPDVPSWGNMLSAARQSLTIYPWLSVAPIAAIAITALGLNLLGDALRDALDPHARARAR